MSVVFLEIQNLQSGNSVNSVNTINAGNFSATNIEINNDQGEGDTTFNINQAFKVLGILHIEDNHETTLNAGTQISAQELHVLNGPLHKLDSSLKIHVPLLQVKTNLYADATNTEILTDNLSIGGDFSTFTRDTNSSTRLEVGTGTIKGNVDITQGAAGNATLALIAHTGQLTINKNLLVLNGDTDAVTAAITNIIVKGDTTLLGGNASDKIDLQSVQFKGGVNIITQAGNDQITIDAIASIIKKGSIFSGITNMKLGAGQDSLSLSAPMAAGTVSFLGKTVGSGN